MAPHEWVRSGAAVVKLDAGDHQHDHSVVGAQPIWWDIAGASVEWALPTAACDQLAGVAGMKGSERRHTSAPHMPLFWAVPQSFSRHRTHQAAEQNEPIRALRYYGCDAWTRIAPDPRSERDVSTRSTYLLKLHDQHSNAVTEPL